MPIEPNVTLGQNVVIFHPDLVNLYGCTIGDECKIATFVEIQRGVVLGQGDRLRAQDLPPQVHRRADDQHPLVPAHLTLEEMEKLAIVQSLRLTGGNKSEAAERLGIHRTSLYDKMRRYGITDPTRPASPEAEAPPPES